MGHRNPGCPALQEDPVFPDWAGVPLQTGGVYPEPVPDQGLLPGNWQKQRPLLWRDFRAMHSPEVGITSLSLTGATRWQKQAVMPVVVGGSKGFR